MDTTITPKMGRNRESTEERLVAAVGKIIADEGFEGLGVRKVAERAGVNKTLIYRYFTSLDGLIHAYMRKHDFWLKKPAEWPDATDIKGYLKAFYRREMADYRGNTALKRLRRWELSSESPILADIRAQREANGLRFWDVVAGFAKPERERTQAVAALLDAGIAHLAMLGGNCRMYNGIDIQSDAGWEQLARGIDALIDIMMESGD